MNLETLRDFCLSLKGSSDDFPFGETVLALRCMGKIFALISLDDDPFTVNLKCDPERAIDLREEYPDLIIPGYHMNKKHWNTIYPEQLSDVLTRELILHSYELIAASLKKSEREALANL